MKNKILLSIIFILICVFGFAACKVKDNSTSKSDSGDISTSENDSSDINIIDSALTLDCFETYLLFVESHHATEIRWTSSDSSIVTVDENGLVKAGVKTGKAVVTASKGDNSDTCEVTVLLKSGVPTMSTENEIYVPEGGAYDFSVNVFYNGINISEYLTFECNFSEGSSDSIADVSVQGNTVTVAGVAVGETSFAVYTTAFGMLYAENVKIVVRNTDIVYVVNGAVNNCLQLRTDNERYTSDVEVYYKNERVSDDLLEWTISDEQVATIGENGKLVMNKEGVAVLSTNYLGRNIAVEIQTIKDREYINVEQTAPIDVDLDMSVIVDANNKKRDFVENETKTSLLKLCETEELGFVVRASLEGTPLSVDGCEFLRGVATLPTKLFGTNCYGKNSLTIEVEYSEVVRVYTLDVLLITKKINSLTEFQKDVTIKWAGDRILGYYALDADIDFNYYEISVWATDWNYDNGFRGTLDGRGYSLKNVKSTFYGITAQMGVGAVVKNLVIPNLKYSGGETTLFTRGASGVTFDTIEITLSDDSACSQGTNPINCGLLIDHVMKNCTFKNITINAHGKDLQKIFGGKNEHRNTSVYENIVIYAKSVTYYENDITVAPDGVTFTKA